MKLRILPSALTDLARGKAFYARLDQGLGGHFLESIFSDIDSLALYAGIHRKVFGYHRLLASAGLQAAFSQVDTRVEVTLNRRWRARTDESGHWQAAAGGSRFRMQPLTFVRVYGYCRHQVVSADD